MSESSRIETLLEALVDGENVDVVPQSRIETYLLALLNGDTNVKEPQSRIEAYLYQLCKNGMSGGGGSGGITPTGTLEITENGTHDVTNYASANVNVASSGGGDLDALIDGSITEVNSNASKLMSNKFAYCKNLISASFPFAKEIGGYVFKGCTGLKTVNVPSVETIYSEAFVDCYNLEIVNCPSAKDLGNKTFMNCYALKKMIVPNVKTLGSDLFYSCRSLTLVDFHEVTEIQSNAFYSCYILVSVILRSETMCTLGNTNVFKHCYHILGTVNSTYNPDGLKDGYIYVPKALIEDYKVATNWTTYASQFRALEDYTVDGTITGELDETKI